MRFDALTFYRLAHQLWKSNVPNLPQLIDLASHVRLTANLRTAATTGQGVSFLHRGTATGVYAGAAMARPAAQIIRTVSDGK